MIRWVRLAAIAALTLALLGVGVGAGLFLVENSHWVRVNVPPQLAGTLGQAPFEIWFPALLGSWLAAALAVVAVAVGSFYYVFRRRQYEGLVARLERELSELRNLPFTSPAPLEDLPEAPDRAAARAMADGTAEDGDDELERA